MKKKLPQILNTVMGAFFGAWLGHAIWLWRDHAVRPGLYELQSAPWYTSILVRGAMMAAVILVCLLLKWILARQDRESPRGG